MWWNRKPVISTNELILGLCDWNKNVRLTDSFPISTLMASKRKVSLWTKAQAQCTSVTDQIFKETSQKSQLNEKKLISPALKPTESPPYFSSRPWKLDEPWRPGWLMALGLFLTIFFFHIRTRIRTLGHSLINTLTALVVHFISREMLFQSSRSRDIIWAALRWHG